MWMKYEIGPELSDDDLKLILAAKMDETGWWLKKSSPVLSSMKKFLVNLPEIVAEAVEFNAENY